MTELQSYEQVRPTTRKSLDVAFLQELLRGFADEESLEAFCTKQVEIMQTEDGQLYSALTTLFTWLTEQGRGVDATHTRRAFALTHALFRSANNEQPLPQKLPITRINNNNTSSLGTGVKTTDRRQFGMTSRFRVPQRHIARGPIREPDLSLGTDGTFEETYLNNPEIIDFTEGLLPQSRLIMRFLLACYADEFC